MPHIELTYSENLEATVDVAALCNVLRQTSINTGIVPVAGVKVRAFCAKHVSIADGDSQHGYIDFSVRMREGRTDEQKQAMTNALFTAAERFLEKQIENHSIGLTMELRDINDSYSPKTGSIRRFLADKS